MGSPTVTVSQGQLRGTERTNIDGGKFAAFLGIPYAKPPVGESRFKAPLPAESWTGVRDATKVGNMSYSRHDTTRKIEGSEDCLFLNVFTRQLPQPNASLKPVMVFIHGGGFVCGTGSEEFYGPQLLMIEDIVLVTLNYRLGALGFLSLQDTSLGVPGNAGLKDQAMALKWVQQNISRFNGDPNNVTIFGESAGSASVHYHVLSQSSKGLFHKAILQSGTALNSWAEGHCMAEEFAKFLGHDVKTEREAFEVLKNTPVDVLYEHQEKFFEKVRPIRPFLPVIEKPNDTAIITKDVIDVIISGVYNKVPIIFGYNTREGMLVEFYNYILKSSGKEVPPPPEDLEKHILSYFQLKKGSPAGDHIYQKIKEVYFKGPDKDDNQRVFISDVLFTAAILATLRSHLATSQQPTYLYRVSLCAGFNVLKNHAGLQHLQGVCHGDELGYLFKSAFYPADIKPESLEDISVRRFVKLWTNFAKYSNPTPEKNAVGVIWPPAKKDQINFLDIGSELRVENNPEPERVALWRDLFKLNPKTSKFL